MRWKVKSYDPPVRIGELATRTGLTTKTIRFYESAGVLPEPERQGSGYRDYEQDAVDRLAFVKAAQAAGLTLAQMRDVIAVRDSSGSPCGHVAELLDAQATELDRRIRELTALRAEVQRLRERARTLDPGRCPPASVCHVIEVGTMPSLVGGSLPHGEQRPGARRQEGDRVVREHLQPDGEAGHAVGDDVPLVDQAENRPDDQGDGKARARRGPAQQKAQSL